MRRLMMTTALVATAGFGTMAQADTHSGVTAGTAPDMVPAFLASEFTGMSLYTLDTEAALTLRSTHAAPSDPAAPMPRAHRWTSSDTFVADRDAWENVGAISDIVMTQDGEVRGILIDVGGFLGFGAQTVMIDIDELYFVAETEAPEGMGDYAVVAAMSRDQLEALPEWSDDQLRIGFEYRPVDHQDEAMADPASGAVSTMAGGYAAASGQNNAGSAGGAMGAGGTMAAGMGATAEGYATVSLTAVSAEQLLDADVFDANGENIGSVSDATMDSADGLRDVIVDVGGFLGIGSHSVALPLENAQLAHNADSDTVRIHVPYTREQLEAMPEYEG